MSAVLVVLAAAFALFRLFGESQFAARCALAAMLVFTGCAHFVPVVRDTMVRMVPPELPNPGAIVFLTGILEILGAVGLVIPQTRRGAGIALCFFFLAVLPANIHAAKAGILINGQPATALWLRIPIQFLFIWLAWWSTR